MDKAKLDKLKVFCEACPWHGTVWLGNAWADWWAAKLPYVSGNKINLREVVFDASVRVEGIVVEQRLTYFANWWGVNMQLSWHSVRTDMPGGGDSGELLVVPDEVGD